MSCLEAGHILSNSLKITFFLFFFCSNVNQIWNAGKNWIFAILQRQHVCTASYSYRFKILVTGFFYKRFTWSLWRISIHTNLQICTIHHDCRGRGKRQNLNRRFLLRCIRRRRFKAARANICRWWMLYNAYKPKLVFTWRHQNSNHKTIDPPEIPPQRCIGAAEN